MLVCFLVFLITEGYRFFLAVLFYHLTGIKCLLRTLGFLYDSGIHFHCLSEETFGKHN